MRTYLQHLAMIGLGLASPLAVAADYPGDLSAFFSQISPMAPRANVPLTFHVVAGPCEHLSSDPSSATLVASENGVVTYRIPGVPDTPCSLASAQRTYAVEGLPAGTHRIDLVMYFIEQPGEIGTPFGFIGGRDLVVLPARRSATVPTTTGHAKVGAICLFLLVGAAARLTSGGRGGGHPSHGECGK